MKQDHDLEISFDRFTPEIELENYVLDGVDDFSRVNLKNSGIYVFLKREGRARFLAKIAIRSKKHSFVGTAHESNPITAFSQAKHHILRQYYRFKKKRRNQIRHPIDWVNDQIAMAT